MTTLLAFASDLHVNSTLGLSTPSVALDAGGTYRASRGQLALWSAWKDYWGLIREFKERCEGECIGVLAGDLNDLNVHNDTELVSKAKADITRMSLGVLEPVLEVVDRLVVIRGTGAHTGKRANLEEEVARDLGDIVIENGALKSWYWWVAEIEGVKLDVAHHPVTSARRPWTLDAAADRAAYIHRCEYLDAGERVPDLVIRGHAHKYVLSNGRLKPLYVQLPPWQLTTSFGYRIGATRVEPPGGVWVLCKDGKYTWGVETFTPRRKKVWRL